jgi:hypothetical protein
MVRFVLLGGVIVVQHLTNLGRFIKSYQIESFNT